MLGVDLKEGFKTTKIVNFQIKRLVVRKLTISN